MADSQGEGIPLWHRVLFGLAAVMTWLLILSGGIVCITDSSHGCPDWPVCHGRLIPPLQMKSIIEWAHRLGSALTVPFLLAAVVVGWRRYRQVRWILRPLLGSLLCLLIVVGFGALVILTGLPRGWAAVDLATALMTLALVVTAATTIFVRSQTPHPVDKVSWRGSFSRLALVTTLFVYAVLVSGVLVARPGAVMRCLNWPKTAGLSLPGDLFDGLHLARFALSLIAGLLLVALVVQAWRTQRHNPTLVRHSTIAAGLWLAAVVVGALMPLPDQGLLMPLASLALVAALWSFLVAIVIRSGMEEAQTPGDARP